MHTSTSPATVVGLLLLIVGGAVYLIGVLAALWRVRSQYSPAMAGSRGLHLGAALGAAGRFWPFGLAALVGIGLLVVAR